MNNKKSELKPWKLLKSDWALNEKWFKVRRDEVELPNGKIVDDYYVWDMPSDIVVIVPVTNKGKFIVCHQYKHGVGRIICEFPAGIIEPNEPAEQAAIRELREETGCEADKLELLTRTAASPTKTNYYQNVFLATGVNKVGEPQFDENEQIVLKEKSPAQIMSMIESGEFAVADSVVGALLAFRKLNLIV